MWFPNNQGKHVVTGLWGSGRQNLELANPEEKLDIKEWQITEFQTNYPKKPSVNHIAVLYGLPISFTITW